MAPFESLLEFGQVERVEELMQERLSRHLAWAFEDACRQYVEDRLHEIGTVVFAAECKWTGRPASVEVGEAFRRKVERLWPDQLDRIPSRPAASARRYSAGHPKHDAWLLSAKDLVE